MRFRGGPCSVIEAGTEKSSLEHRRDLNWKEGVHLGGHQKRMEFQCRINEGGEAQPRERTNP